MDMCRQLDPFFNSSSLIKIEEYIYGVPKLEFLTMIYSYKNCMASLSCKIIFKTVFSILRVFPEGGGAVFRFTWWIRWSRNSKRRSNYKRRIKKGLNLFIKNKEISILGALTVLWLKRPKFCYHEALSIAGNCLIGLVEINIDFTLYNIFYWFCFIRLFFIFINLIR